MVIETARLSLREMRQSDYPALARILRDPDVMYAYEGAFSESETQKWLDKQIKNYEDHGFGLWAVFLRATDEMIGQCGLTWQNYKDIQVLEVGYLFQKAFWHKGYATEAAIACRDYAFRELNAAEVFSIIRDNNIASQNVAKRNGMIIADTFIRHHRGIDMPHYLFFVKRGWHNGHHHSQGIT
ncbi:MAG: GNAT family N-acetyltransferase [Clostridiales bacterium]|nr:GNAT family N-acetyltransferase [Clostridiales bacterium]